MATESKTPPPPPPSPTAAADSAGQVSETIALANQNVKPAGQESATESFTKSITETVEPIREDQVQNAVKFLSHPKVRGSPVIHRRTFLEKKGLTNEEIEEAFRRVPDPPSNATVAEAAISNQAARQTSTTSSQQLPTTNSQHVSPSHGGVLATHTSRPYTFLWYHAFVAVGILAASGAGTAVLVKNSLLPRFKAWIRKIVREEDDIENKESLKPNPVEEAVEAAKSAASAAASIAKISEELLNARFEEKKYHEAFTDVLKTQVEEMKSIRNAIDQFESRKDDSLSYDKQVQEHNMQASGNGFAYRNSYVDRVDPNSFSAFQKRGKTNEMQEVNSGRPSSSPVSEESMGAPYSKSYMEIMAMIQRGETPPGIKEVNDLPPNPNQLPTNPRIAPRIKPWGDIQQDQSKHSGFRTQPRSDEYGDIQGNTHLSQLNGKSHETSWEQKNVKITEIQPEEPRVVSHERASTERRGRWIPPQPPKVVVPEAAAAIRQPKPAASKQSVEIEQSITRQESPQPSTAVAISPVETEQEMIQQEITQPRLAETVVLDGQSSESYLYPHKQSVGAGMSNLNGVGSSNTNIAASSYHSEIQEETTGV